MCQKIVYLAPAHGLAFQLSLNPPPDQSERGLKVFIPVALQRNTGQRSMEATGMCAPLRMYVLGARMKPHAAILRSASTVKNPERPQSSALEISMGIRSDAKLHPLTFIQL